MTVIPNEPNEPNEPDGEVGAIVDFQHETPYEIYVGVTALRRSVRTYTDHPSEPAFLVITQVMELTFILLRIEWERAQAQLRADDRDSAIATLRRTVRHLVLLNASWVSLAAMTPVEFEGFRPALGEASGFQSASYRHVEFLLGLKSEPLIRPHRSTPAVYAELRAALIAPSLYDDVLAHLARTGHPLAASVLDRDLSSEYPADPAIEQAWVAIFLDPRPGNDAFMLAEALTDIAEEFDTWRRKHLIAVRRAMGMRNGSGGSTGSDWLERSLARTVFPELWSARTHV
jgi:tryptophan 2,3-dioxygenase